MAEKKTKKKAKRKTKKKTAKKRVAKKKASRKAPDQDNGKHPGGRPSSYLPEYADQAYKLALLGAKDTQIAEFFGVQEKTLNNWKKAHPEFLQSLKAGKDQADANVGQSLYQRALGYSHPEDKIFNHNGQPLVVPTTKHYPPDTTAAIFWLKNRQKELWRDKHDHEHTGKDGGAIIHEVRRTIVDAGHSDS